ncbi:hypothetical protein [Gloeomargarita lithophora]|uniref:hypothetical protein n=1 Tax=Gloeomargarita lithophora TaxID=1188228 RepID=UPI0008F966AC|nr:hypothetical protein [Gloeomargarita lithophora]
MTTTLWDLIFIGLTLLLVWLVLGWLIKVTLDTGKTLLTIGIILLILQFGLGVGPRTVLTRAWEIGQKWWPSPLYLFPAQFGLW